MYNEHNNPLIRKFYKEFQNEIKDLSIKNKKFNLLITYRCQNRVNKVLKVINHKEKQKKILITIEKFHFTKFLLKDHKTEATILYVKYKNYANR